jgi:hypothetical protein
MIATALCSRLRQRVRPRRAAAAVAAIGAGRLAVPGRRPHRTRRPITRTTPSCIRLIPLSPLMMPKVDNLKRLFPELYREVPVTVMAATNPGK